MDERSLPCCVHCVGKCTPCKARLCHDVVLLGDAERRLTQKVLGASDVHWVTYGPEARGGMPEAMQVHRKSESFLGASAHGLIYANGGHRSLFIGRPEGTVRTSTGDTGSEPFQVQIDARA